MVEYVGIASDEPYRLERYEQSATEDHCYITLNDMGISENGAMDICRKHNLLSPKYEKALRSGCFFCHNQTNADLYDLWKNYPTYFARLEEMEKDSHNFLKGNKSLYQIRRLFEMGKIPKNRKAKNKFKQLSIFD